MFLDAVYLKYMNLPSLSLTYTLGYRLQKIRDFITPLKTFEIFNYYKAFKLNLTGRIIITCMWSIMHVYNVCMVKVFALLWQLLLKMIFSNYISSNVYFISLALSS